MFENLKKAVDAKMADDNKQPFGSKEYKEALQGLMIMAKNAKTPEARAEAQAIYEMMEKVYKLGLYEGRKGKV